MPRASLPRLVQDLLRPGFRVLKVALRLRRRFQSIGDGLLTFAHGAIRNGQMNFQQNHTKTKNAIVWPIRVNVMFMSAAPEDRCRALGGDHEHHVESHAHADNRHRVHEAQDDEQLGSQGR